MAKDNFPNCLPVILRYEGGYSNNAHDPGGSTLNGITQKTYDGWRRVHGQPSRDVRAMPPAERDAIYWTDFWQPTGCDPLPPGVDLALFDYGVNSGPVRARRLLAVIDELSPVEAVHAVCRARLSFVKALTNWRYFGNGWSRRIADVEARGVRMVLSAAGLTPAEVKPRLETKAAEAKDKSSRAGKAGGVAGSGVGGTGAATATQGMDGHWQWFAVLLAALLIGGAVAFVLWRWHAARAAAFDAVAGEITP